MLSNGKMSGGAQSHHTVNLEPMKRRHFTGHAACLWESVTEKVKELNTGVGFILQLTVFMANTTFIGMLR